MTLDANQQSVLNNLLIEAVGNKDLTHVRLYVDKGADVHTKVQMWEKRGSDTPTEKGSSPLYHLVCQDNFTKGISDFLLEKGVDVDARNFNGTTPLMLAVMAYDLDRVRYFVSKGADPLAANNRGEIALELARKLWVGRDSRQDIIDALVVAIDAPVEKKPAPQENVSAVETSRDIRALRPLEITRRKKGGGLNL